MAKSVIQNKRRFLLGTAAGAVIETVLLFALVSYAQGGYFTYEAFLILLISGSIAGLITDYKRDKLIAGFLSAFAPVFLAIIVISLPGLGSSPVGATWGVIPSNNAIGVVYIVVIATILGSVAGVFGAIGGFIGGVIRSKI